MISWSIIKDWMTRNVDHESWETGDSEFSSNFLVLFNVQSGNFIVQWIISVNFFGKFVILTWEFNTVRTCCGEELNENNLVIFNKWSEVGISQDFNMLKFDFFSLFTCKISMFFFSNLSGETFPWLLCKFVDGFWISVCLFESVSGKSKDWITLWSEIILDSSINFMVW